MSVFDENRPLRDRDPEEYKAKMKDKEYVKNRMSKRSEQEILSHCLSKQYDGFTLADKLATAITLLSQMRELFHENPMDFAADSHPKIDRPLPGKAPKISLLVEIDKFLNEKS